MSLRSICAFLAMLSVCMVTVGCMRSDASSDESGNNPPSENQTREGTELSKAPDSLYTRIVDASIGKPDWESRELGHVYRLLIVTSGPQYRAYTEKLKLTDLGWTRKVVSQFYLDLSFIDEHFNPEDYYNFRAGPWQGYREVELIVDGTCRVLKLTESGEPKTTEPCKNK